MGLAATPYLQVVKGSSDLFLKFWDPSITSEQFKIETYSNLISILTMRGTRPNDKNSKVGQRRSERGHVTYF